MNETAGYTQSARYTHDNGEGVYTEDFSFIVPTNVPDDEALELAWNAAAELFVIDQFTTVELLEP